MIKARLLTLVFVLALGCGDDDLSDPLDAASSDAASPGDAGSGDTSSNNGDAASPMDAGRADAVAADSGSGSSCGLNQWEQMMLDAHNEWRASVSPPAADMHRIYWDRDIAQNAADWVSSCDPSWPHSSEEDRGNSGYEVLGENLSFCAGTGCSDLPEITDGSGLGDGVGWWDERTDYDWETDESSGVTSHYTQMVSSNVYSMGCATQRCGAPGPNGWDGEWWWTICQYGPRGRAYWRGTKPYEAGDGGLVEPSEETFAEHTGMCR